MRSRSGVDPVNVLWVLDLATGETRIVADPTGLLQAHADADADAVDGVEETAAERARRERARESAGGIVSYDADAALTTATFVLNGRLFRIDIIAGTSIELPVGGAAFDPRLDPTGSLIAYVSGSALRVIDVA